MSSLRGWFAKAGVLAGLLLGAFALQTGTSAFHEVLHSAQAAESAATDTAALKELGCGVCSLAHSARALIPSAPVLLVRPLQICALDATPQDGLLVSEFPFFRSRAPPASI